MQVQEELSKSDIVIQMQEKDLNKKDHQIKNLKKDIEHAH